MSRHLVRACPKPVFVNEDSASCLFESACPKHRVAVEVEGGLYSKGHYIPLKQLLNEEAIK